MFEGKSIFDIIQLGGLTMYVLISCSMISLAVILERLIDYFRKSRLDRIKFMDQIKSEIEAKGSESAIKICEKSKAPIAAIVKAGLKNHKYEEKVISNAMEREIMIETVKLEKQGCTQASTPILTSQATGATRRLLVSLLERLSSWVSSTSP